MSQHEQYKNNVVYKLSDLAAIAQADMQKAFKHIDPMIGINHGMRGVGFAADILTIDNQGNKKRITFILKDEQLGSVEYQFGFIDQDPDDAFSVVSVHDLTAEKLYGWMEEYFVE